MMIFGASSLHPKIPFPAAVVEREGGPLCTRNSDVRATAIRDLGPALQLFRIESERLASSLHPEIPFPAAVVEREVGRHCTRNSDFRATVIRDFGTGAAAIP